MSPQLVRHDTEAQTGRFFMSLSPPSLSLLPAAFRPEPLIAIACPGCGVAVAVTAAFLGQAAECPLCGSGFRVPSPNIGTPQLPSTPNLPATPHVPATPHFPATIKAELAFDEPVTTVGSGDATITLRRLTPAEKASRRTRRNLIMMLVGVSILMAIVLLLGIKRPSRRCRLLPPSGRIR